MATSSKPTRPRPMSAAHKEALAKGREEGRAIRQYLEALEASKPKRGRKRTPESIKKRIDVIESEMPYVDALTNLHLLQERADLEAELAQSDEIVDISDLEKAFVKVAKSYGDRKGITYSTWRSAGVATDVLKQAGVPRTRG